MSESMTNYFIFRDKRLKGNLPFMASVLISSQLDATTPLTTGFSKIQTAAQVYGKIKTLFILCHGIGRGPVVRDFWWRGGQGLELGQEGVNSQNVANWIAIKNSVENIVVYACGAAHTGVVSIFEQERTTDGRGLMTELAKHTNAVVYASDKVQWYYPSDFNFGKWEGTVSAFNPNGSITSGVRPPTEVIDVISPIDDPQGFQAFSFGAYQQTRFLRESRRNK